MICVCESNSKTDQPVSMPVEECSNWLRNMAESLGFSAVGFTTLHKDPRYAMLERWVGQDLYADMNWFADTLADRIEPQQKFPEARTAVVLATSYDHVHDADPEKSIHHISRYARGRDYHTVLRKRLQKISKGLRNNWGSKFVWSGSDSSPVAEKPLAVMAGLGWIGRSGNFIHPKYGSYLFLSIILTDLDLVDKNSVEISDLCGTCRACIDICPTDAILSDRLVNADRCISYRTIEAPRKVDILSSDDFAGGWLHGCDDCQEVCPWVRKARNSKSNAGDQAFAPHDRWLQHNTAELSLLSGNQIEDLIKASPVARQRPAGFHQNLTRWISQGMLTPVSAGSETDGGEEDSS